MRIGQHVLVFRAEGALGEDAEVGAGEALDHAEHDAAEEGAGQVADAAQHGGREGLDAGDEADEGIDAGELEAPHDAGGAAQGAAHEEGQG